MNWSLKTNTRLLILVTSVISAATGAAATYVATNKILEQKFNERLEEEIAKAKVFYQEMYSTPTFVAEEPANSESDLVEMIKEATAKYDGPAEDLVGKALDAARSYRGDGEEYEEDRARPVIVNNIFQNRTPPGDAVLEALLSERDPSEPYLITREEFMANEPEHDQKTFTYYDGDDVLVDDEEEFQPIDDIDRVAGEDNLLHFGYGSQDEFVVYVRNETLNPPLDLCITRVTGKYSVEVMDMEDDGPSLKHSQVRKFRIQDD